MYYHRKLIISGQYIELYNYEKSLMRDFTRKKKPKKELEKIEVEIENNLESKQKSKTLQKRKDSINRTRSEIRRLVNSNQDFSKFYTLTFAENITEVKVANKHFNKFIMRMEYHYGKFKYISVIEFQKRGAVHYHFLCNLPFIESKEIESVWGLGFIKIKKTEQVTNLGAYFCKYLQKDMTDKRLFNKKKYFCSKEIERPTEVYEDHIIEKLIFQYGLDRLTADYKSTFSGEYTGKVDYQQFKLKNLNV